MHSELSHTVGIYIPSDVSCADYETYKIVLYTVLISAVDGEILLLPVRVRRFENARTLLSILTLGQILIFVLLQSGLWRPMKTIWKRTFTTNSSSFTNCWKLILKTGCRKTPICWVRRATNVQADYRCKSADIFRTSKSDYESICAYI